ncbi:DUF3089 domain-containing protein [Methanogenium organophilum]|uniref:DUF3089 domain-containing protein n=1 Tax=Methanogenium organophilum TaxID=2199 RepID=A0A9X9S5V6_METOG|nr:DUF3089 domain-containing protein [Methanogenium organophilum]WAI02282.1 DUF3089 domain-containing protein [Methanogenium organophilum]
MINKSPSLIWFTALVGICVILACGCVNEDTSPTPDNGAMEPTPEETNAEETETADSGTAESAQNPDYADEYYWVSLPSIDKAVDVFYVYPTVSANITGQMDITSADERSLAEGIYQAQASVYEPNANVFAPYYRQMTTNVDMSAGGLATDTPEFKQGAIDVQNAFEYYIENLNEGRPFIIAGHSQGTMALIELIKNRFGDDEELRSRMVAAYLIGYTVTDSDLEAANLTAAERADDVGVVVTYNTQSPTSAGGPMLMAGAHCINPLNWKTDDTYAPASENLGARFYNDSTGEFLREVDNYCDAQINLTSGALMTTIPEGEELDIGPYTEGVYHRYDYAFWYRNLEQNVGDRIRAFSEQ